VATCGTCAHCDTSEARELISQRLAGYCTLAGGWFNGKPVPVWLTCPAHEPVASSQGDGDPGSEAA